LISVNFTLLVQLANFLILLVILNYLLFKPILRVLDERERLVTESAEMKEKFGQLASQSIGEYESRLLAAKQEAMGIRAAERTEAMAGFRQAVQEARVVGTQDLEKARQEVASEAGKSRETLLVDAHTLADSIAVKLVGRKL
jgi:F-type H+-transporting ATPase subunit b